MTRWIEMTRPRGRLQGRGVSVLYARGSVGDVIAELQKFDPDAPIMATWEGIYRCVVVEKPGDEEPFRDASGRAVVVLDVDRYAEQFEDFHEDDENDTNNDHEDDGA